MLDVQSNRVDASLSQLQTRHVPGPCSGFSPDSLVQRRTSMCVRLRRRGGSHMCHKAETYSVVRAIVTQLSSVRVVILFDLLARRILRCPSSGSSGSTVDETAYMWPALISQRHCRSSTLLLSRCNEYRHIWRCAIKPSGEQAV